jgi:predicted ATP-grasp superfamily ATP-dependent carboligase
VRALVLDGDARSALAVTRSLGGAGVAVTIAAAAPRSLAGASRHAAARLVLPDPDRAPEALAAALVELSRRWQGDLWLPVTDASLSVVDGARQALGDVVLPFPPSDVLALAWDKARLLDLARAAGVPCPLTHAPEDVDAVRALAADLEYPVVLKPRHSRWRRAGVLVQGLVSEVDSAATLPGAWLEAHRAVPRPLIQERIPGHGLGLFVLADRGRIIARFAHRRLREKPPTGGVSVLRESIAVPDLLRQPAARLLESLAWHGVCMIEFRVDARDGTPYLMEINPRFWGSLQLAIDAGVDFPRLLYELASGHTPDPVERYRLGVRSRWLLGDLDHLLIRLRHRHERAALPPALPGLGRAILDFLDPRAGRLEVQRLDDPGPGRYELASYLRQLCRRPEPSGRVTHDPDAVVGGAGQDGASPGARQRCG